MIAVLGGGVLAVGLGIGWALWLDRAYRRASRRKGF